jgi:hypothetical protein
VRRSDAPPRVPQPDDAFAGASPQAGFPEAPTYFDRPLLKAPHWGWNVVAYLFVGGITGGLGIVAAVARGDRAEDLRLRRAARFAGLALASASPILLISHLGRPERFLNMLRIVKFKSPMSMGVWGLLLYSGTGSTGSFRRPAFCCKRCSDASCPAIPACCSARPRFLCGVRGNGTFRPRRYVRASRARARSRRSTPRWKATWP